MGPQIAVNPKPRSAIQEAEFQSRVDLLYNAIQGAVFRRHWHEVFALVKNADAGPEIAAALRQRDVFGVTPLKAAIVAGQPGTVDLMVKAGADLDEVDANGDMPLANALAQGRLDIVRCLVEHGADTSAMGGGSGLTLLMRAISARQVEIALYLIEAGAPCGYRITGSSGRSAVDYALEEDFPEVFLALVAKGALAGVIYLPLEMAVNVNALKIIEVCLVRADIVEPVSPERFDELVSLCNSEEARQIMLSWRTEHEVSLTIGGSVMEVGPKRRTLTSL